MNACVTKSARFLSTQVAIFGIHSSIFLFFKKGKNFIHRYLDQASVVGGTPLTVKNEDRQ